MKIPTNLVVVCLIALNSLIFSNMSEAANEEIGFIETFALAENREEALKQLIPGTQEYYYFNALHAQISGKHDEVKNWLEPWIKRYGETAQVWEIRNREALMLYKDDPKKSLEYLRHRLGLNFNHRQRKLNEKPNYPTKLNPDQVTWEAYQVAAFARSSTLSLISDKGLDAIARSDIELDSKRRRDLLARLQHPDYPRLVGLINADFRTKESRGFGEFGIHNQLLPEQLDSLLDLRPQLINDTNFVNAKIKKLHPNADVDWRRDAAEREAYLTRVWDFSKTLAPAYNSLKAHALYQLLDHHRRQGEYPRDLFMTYLKLPRSMSYVEPRYLNNQERRQNMANLNVNYQPVTMCPTIGNDEPLVRDFLLNFFVEDDSWEGYATFVRDTYLKPLFAEAKLTNGLGDAEQWFSLLSPTAVQGLKDRVDLEFSPANRDQFSPEDAVSLDVFVKNVDQLMVKVYEINGLNYFLDQKRELNTDLNLDGLIANVETAHDYEETPIRRVKRTFTFDQLKGKRGVWVVEFIGNGISSRALVRKGRLQYLSQVTGAGVLVTVLDQNNDVAKDPAVWFGGRKYEPNEDDVISLPFSSQPGNQPIVLTDGDFATLEFLSVPSENYRLDAGFFVERESLLPGTEAELAIRPSLKLNGRMVPVSILEEVKLSIRSVDQDGIETVSEVPNFELKDTEETIHKFRVPNRLQGLSFHLEAKVAAVSRGGAKEALNDSQHIALNSIDTSQFVADIHLSRIGGEYILEVLGKSGEVVKDRPVYVSVWHEDFTTSHNVNLKTDELGRIELGALPGIERIEVSGNWLPGRKWSMAEDAHTLPNSVHGVAGKEIRIPATLTEQQLDPSDFAIFEMRSGTPVRNDFGKAKFEDGLIVIEGLPRGDYQVVLRNPEHRVMVRVTESTKATDRYALSEYRHLELKNGKPLQIGSLKRDGDNVTVSVKNASPSTRLHIVATRFLPEKSAYDFLIPDLMREPTTVSRGSAETLFVSGRDIGEEYRYILERRASKKFPGNMLTRPGILLNPWALRDTATAIDDAEQGEEYEKSDEAKKSSRGAAPAAAAKVKNGHSGDVTTNLDFLAKAAPVAFNLAPDENGVISIPRDELGDRQHLHVVAIDWENVAYRQLSLPEEPATRFLDLRLKQSLDLQKRFSQVRKVTQLGKGAVLEIPDLRSSDFEVYDTVAAVYGAMMAVNGDATFGEFGFVLQWPNLPIERKRELYSKYASHELNFFLSRKDVEFFEQVIQPYLKNKRDKTFMDDFLIASDLTEYTKPWKFNRLNIPERILLGRRIGGDEPGTTARHIQEIFALQPVNQETEQYLFRSALRGRGMSGGFGGGAVYAGKDVSGRQGLAVTETAPTADYFAPPQESAEGLSRSSGGVRMRQLGRKNAPGGGGADPAAPAGAAPQGNAMMFGAMIRDEAEAVDSFADMDGAVTERAQGKKRELAKYRADKANAEFDDEMEKLEESAVFGIAGEKLRAVRSQLGRRALFRKLESTKEWAENNYYHLPIEQQIASLITTNAFWRDYAAWDGEGNFSSREFPGATRHFAEMMLALAVLDVPFDAAEHDLTIEDGKLTLKAQSPLLVFHEEIEEAPEAEDKPPLLVSQNFFRNDDRYLTNQVGERTDKFVTDEFLTGVLYGGQIVVTNPTSSTQKVDLLLQIPQGALPISGSDYTTTQHIHLAPFSTQKVESYFYFPVHSGDGTFTHYPVHLAKDEKVIAWADAFNFKVVDQLSKIDEASWDYLSQFGTEREVLDYLAANNVQALELSLIAWRCRENVDFFRQVIRLLDERHRYDKTLWSYGIFHNETPVAREYLLHRDDFLQQCGRWIETELVSIAPIERHWYQHLEYSPLVNARQHQLGRDRKILNDRFRGQYQQHMKVLSYKPAFSPDDQLSIAGYLLLQDRVEEGLDWLAKVKPDDVETKIQYDYLDAYAALYREEPQVAAQLADKYEEHPVDRWQQRFAQVAQQVKEIDEADPNLTENENRDQQQDKMASTEPGFEIATEGNTVTVDYRNLDEVTVNYYEMDLEFLFSSKPFVSGDSGQFSYIRPNESTQLKLPDGKATLEFEVPDQYASKNVLVEIVGAGDRKSSAVFANSLKVDLTENYGRVQIRNDENDKPMSKVYVKVYSRFDDGTVKFFKDGYTDLRGKFDYVSLNTDELNRVEKFSLLIMSENEGALVREASPPQR